MHRLPPCGRRCATSAGDLPGDVRVVVVRGEGRAFSAGLDLAVARPTAASLARSAELARCHPTRPPTRIAGYQAAFTWLARPDIVSIAAVQGHAIGAGFQLALACDLRVLTEDAKFTMAEVTLGPGARSRRHEAAGRAGRVRPGAGDLRDRPPGRCRRGRPRSASPPRSYPLTISTGGRRPDRADPGRRTRRGRRDQGAAAPAPSADRHAEQERPSARPRSAGCATWPASGSSRAG